MEYKLLKIINTYGLIKTLKHIHTEYFELDEAIIKYEDVNNIAEEIADIIVMLKQFQYFYNIKDEQIEKIMNYKVNRELERIRNK